MPAKKLTTERAGRALAVKMLCEIEEKDCDDEGHTRSSIEAVYRREGMQQDNVVLRYIDAIQRQGGRDALAGFCAVLSDYIGAAAGGGAPDSPFYTKLTERDITGSPGPWPTTADADNERKAAFQSFMSKVLPGGEGADHAS